MFFNIKACRVGEGTLFPPRNGLKTHVSQISGKTYRCQHLAEKLFVIIKPLWNPSPFFTPFIFFYNSLWLEKEYSIFEFSSFSIVIGNFCFVFSDVHMAKSNFVLACATLQTVMSLEGLNFKNVYAIFRTWNLVSL